MYKKMFSAYFKDFGHFSFTVVCFVLFFFLGNAYKSTCDWSKSQRKIQRCLNHFTYNLGQALQLAPT